MNREEAREIETILVEAGARWAFVMNGDPKMKGSMVRADRLFIAVAGIEAEPALTALFHRRPNLGIHPVIYPLHGVQRLLIFLLHQAAKVKHLRPYALHGAAGTFRGGWSDPDGTIDEKVTQHRGSMSHLRTGSGDFNHENDR